MIRKCMDSDFLGDFRDHLGYAILPVILNQDVIVER